MKRFYRVSNTETQQGLWYDMEGKFTGLIHTEFSFCHNTGLQMPYDEELAGYLSATPSLKDLFKWFTRADIIELQKRGYSIHVYETDDFWFYEPFQHYVIGKANSILFAQVRLFSEVPTINLPDHATP